MNMAGTQRIAALLVMLFAATMFSGCKSVHWSKAEFNKPIADAKKKKKPEPTGIPERMVVIWRDAVYESGASKAARGFGGRFYFYDKESKAVKVEGELVIYAFDDTGSTNTTEADRKYVFGQDRLESHFSETALGASYSFWIPWDQVGGVRRSIALIPVFKTADGQIVRGDQTVNVLSGKAPESELADVAAVKNDAPGVTTIAAGWQNKDRVNQVAHFDEANPNIIMQSETRRTTTIDVPSETASRMQSATGGVRPAPPSGMLAPAGGLQPATWNEPVKSQPPKADSSSARRELREKTSHFRPWPGMTSSDGQK